MDLHSSALRTLRDAMLERGHRESLRPPPRAPTQAGPAQADLQAMERRVAPLCEALYLLMAVDGRCEAREYAALRGAIRALTDGALSTAALNGMLGRFAERLEAEGRARRLEHVAAQLSADRGDAEAAFMLGAALVLADDSVTLDESCMLDELGDLLGISKKRRAALLADPS